MEPPPPEVSVPIPTTPLRTGREVEDEFVGLWRSMASLWGISPTMAEIHGLLFITGAALSMDELMERLMISRGNVSMSLSKLLEWGLVHKVPRRGDRREHYAALGDVAEIFALVAAQRKRREVDPMLRTLRRCQEQLRSEGQPGESLDRERTRRVEDLLTFLTAMDSLAQRFFESHGSLRAVVELLAGQELRSGSA